MPRVSFILPAYKRKYLRESIASILAQTFHDFELVVVDDDSPQDLKPVVDSFSDPRLSYRRNEKNLGRADLVASWSHAMTYASGEWCVLASDDDLYHPEYLTSMLELIRRYPQVDLVRCRTALIDAQGKVLRLRRPRYEFESGIQALYHGSALIFENMMADMMFRRSAYQRIGGFVNFPTAWYTDVATAVRLAWEKGVATSGKVLFYGRLSGENISTRSDDIAVKVDAAVRYLEWVDRILPTAVPHDDDDRTILGLLPNAVRQAVLDEVRDNLDLIKWYRCLRILRESGLPQEFVRDMRKRRLSKILDFRRFLVGGWRYMK